MKKFSENDTYKKSFRKYVDNCKKSFVKCEYFCKSGLIFVKNNNILYIDI